ncbi:MAG TPA: hydroxyisourate hydrolase [Actinocrinis sp.]|nr:hydroxyisourate hydrolase [Actinocrinis sp.]
MTLSTHVLDAMHGHPAAGIAVRLDAAVDDGWKPLAETATGEDGRARDGLAAELSAGRYRLVFDTAGYFAAQGVDEFFFPEVAICFTVADPGAHYHVPLLLSPFAYSTYRGS